MFEVKVPFRVLRNFTHKASVTSVNAEANVHSADWLMSVFVNELALPHVRSQLGQCVRAAVPKDYERYFRWSTFVATAIWSCCEGMLQLLHQELITPCSSSEYPQCTVTATPSFCCYKKSKVNFQPVNTGRGAHLPLEANWARLIFRCVGLATPPPQRTCYLPSIASTHLDTWVERSILWLSALLKDTTRWP